MRIERLKGNWFERSSGDELTDQKLWEILCRIYPEKNAKEYFEKLRGYQYEAVKEKEERGEE